jgi:hypothetical protein
LRRQLDIRRETIEAVESFLMTYRADLDGANFISVSRELARETLAFFLGTQDQQVALENLFALIAARIERTVPDRTQQARYGRTLLGVNACIAIDQWVAQNLFELRMLDSMDEMLDVLWPILVQLSSDKRLGEATPADALQGLARGWLAGAAFKDLLGELEEHDAVLPHGRGQQRFSIDVVVDICEQTFAFEFALFLAAIKESYAEAIEDVSAAIEFAEQVDLLQKRLKYGLPSRDAISYFEIGFSERVVAQQVAGAVFWESATSTADARSLLSKYYEDVETVLGEYPAYFSSVFARLTS